MQSLVIALAILKNWETPGVRLHDAAEGAYPVKKFYTISPWHVEFDWDYEDEEGRKQEFHSIVLLENITGVEIPSDGIHELEKLYTNS